MTHSYTFNFSATCRHDAPDATGGPDDYRYHNIEYDVDLGRLN